MIPARRRGLAATWVAVALVAACGTPSSQPAPGGASAAPSIATPIPGATSSADETPLPAFTTRTGQAGSLLYIENSAGPDVIRLGLDVTLGAAVSQLSLNGRDLITTSSHGLWRLPLSFAVRAWKV